MDEEGFWPLNLPFWVHICVISRHSGNQTTVKLNLLLIHEKSRCVRSNTGVVGEGVGRLFTSMQ